jgi:hypothetical protein
MYCNLVHAIALAMARTEVVEVRHLPDRGPQAGVTANGLSRSSGDPILRKVRRSSAPQDRRPTIGLSLNRDCSRPIVFSAEREQRCCYAKRCKSLGKQANIFNPARKHSHNGRAARGCILQETLNSVCELPGLLGWREMARVQDDGCLSPPYHVAHRLGRLRRK